jgi:hypothetical protein
MIKFDRVSVMNWENAIRGARNPMNSWEKSDSQYCGGQKLEDCEKWQTCHMDYCVGENDLALMMRLRNAGTDHRKFMRQIFVSVDITAPLYWWKEADTYTVGKTQNSCSTMHKIHAKEFTIDDFSHEHIEDTNMLWMIPDELNKWRSLYLETKDKRYWWQMIQLLPTSYNQLRTVTLNYEVLANMYAARKEHKLDEWRDLCAWIKTLPYSQLITGEDEAYEKEPS